MEHYRLLHLVFSLWSTRIFIINNRAYFVPPKTTVTLFGGDAGYRPRVLLIYSKRLNNLSIGIYYTICPHLAIRGT